MTVKVVSSAPGFIELTEPEAISLFDKAAWNHLSISGEEFLRRWDRGDYACVNWDLQPGLAEVAMLIPFVR